MHLRKWIATKLYIIVLLPILISACQTFLQSYPQTANPVALMVSPLGAAVTPTPFQPLDPTPTYIPTALPTLPPTPIPESVSNSPGDTQPVGEISIPENQINVLLLGTDQRMTNRGFRTDTIILISINTTAKKVSMVSFPRDLYVYIPGWTHQRINTAMFHGGFDLLARTLKHNFGVKPEYYVIVDFRAFRKIINSLGGVDVKVARSYTDEYWDHTYKTIPKGTVHMDGATALWYARARKASNDFDRARRQQEVIYAVAKQVLSMDALESAKDLYDIYIENVVTNLTWTEIAPLIPLMVHYRDPSLIQRYVIGPKQVYDWITPGGAMVLLPQQDKIIKLLKEALGNQ